MGYPEPPTRYSPLLAQHTAEASVQSYIQIVHPNHGDVYAIDPVLRREFQTIQLSAIAPPEMTQITWYVDGKPFTQAVYPYTVRWPLTPGIHTIQARFAHADIASEVVTITVMQ
jgi:membrane carboxypeptidase/penicillin-binding protein PbpC